jgi:WXG100 family type VII secretion target
MVYSFSADGVNSAAQTFIDKENILTSAGTNLQHRIQSMNWDGTAGPNFKQAHDDWTKIYNKMTAEMTQIAQMLHKTAGNQQNVEASNASSAQFFTM